MKNKHRLPLAFSTIFLLLVNFVVAYAQEPLPIPPAEDETGLQHNVTIVRDNAPRSDTRANYVILHFSYRNKTSSWNGSNYSYTVHDMGPLLTNGVTFTSVTTSLGSCSISGGTTVNCNYGSYVPKKVHVYGEVRITLHNNIDWYRLRWSNGTSSAIWTYIWDPTPYASNLVSDISLETPGVPAWNLNGNARQVCNKPGRVFSYSGSCAIRLVNGGKATLRLSLSELYTATDSAFISYAVKTSGYYSTARLVTKMRNSSTGKFNKSVLRISSGTTSYKNSWVNTPTGQISDQLIISFVSGKNGKVFIDDIRAYMVDHDDLTN